jgi:hypothetical protein
MTANASPEEIAARRSRWPWGLAALGAVVLLLGGLWIFLQARAADIAENTIRDYARRFGIEGLHLDVQQLTPWRADVHGLRVDRPDSRTALRLDSLVVDYSPLGLKAQVIDSIKLSGLYLRLERTPDGWKIAGLPPRLAPAVDSRTGNSRPPPSWGWRFNHLEIISSQLDIQLENRQVRIPFEFQMQATDTRRERFQGRLDCRPWDQAMTADLNLDLAQGHLALDGAAARLNLQRLSQALDTTPDFRLKGTLAASGGARFGLAPFSLDAAEIELRLPGAIALKPDWTLRATTPDQPLARAYRTANRTWKLHVPGFTLATPHQLQVREWKGQLAPAAAGWQWNGGFDLALRPRAIGAAGGPPTATENTMPCTYQGEWKTDGRWSMALAGQGPRWKLALNPNRSPAADTVQMDFAPRLNVAASGHTNAASIEGSARLADFRVSRPDAAIQIPMLSLQARAEGAWPQLEGNYNLSGDNLRARLNPLTVRLPRLFAKGTFQLQNDHFLLRGQTQLARGSVRWPARKIHLEGLSLNLPFAWPYAAPTGQGRLALASATWNSLALGAIQGRLWQQDSGLNFKLAHDSPVLPGGQLAIDGRLAAGTAGGDPRLAVNYRFERAVSPTDIDLGALKADLTGIHLNGRIVSEGHATYKAGQLFANLHMALTGGRLVMPDQKIGMVGLRGTIAFPDLLSMRSAPRQPFSFERIFVGDIAATEGALDFQIEPGGVFFLEQGRFRWCQGTVYLPATRIVPGKNDYDLTLWCDRLKLAPLLEQLGAAQVEGGGSVSGRIPIQIRAGQYRVDGGFLYSSPGDGGTIRLRDSDMLTAGIPPGTPPYNQLELARQALREYDYDWVKLRLETDPQEDLLRLKLQLNGRPTHPLPFVYDAQAGGFVPAGPDSPGSRFQGIKLDVNFTLPLNRLLEYKELLKLFSSTNGDRYAQTMDCIDGRPADRHKRRLHPASRRSRTGRGQTDSHHHRCEC